MAKKRKRISFPMGGPHWDAGRWSPCSSYSWLPQSTGRALTPTPELGPRNAKAKPNPALGKAEAGMLRPQRDELGSLQHVEHEGCGPGDAQWDVGCGSKGCALRTLSIRTPAQWDADMDQAPSILQTEKA